MHVRLTVEQATARPVLEPESWEHIIECPLSLPSGHMVIAGCTDYLLDCPKVEIKPGEYAVRVCGRGFSDSAPEQYFSTLWPSSSHEARVLKQYEGR